MQNHSQSNTLELHNMFGVKVILNGVEVSVIGGLSSSDPPQPEAFDKILKIVRERSQTETTSLVSVASNPAGFLSTSFLETGVKYSQSVCRIARYFSRTDFIDFIDKIQSTLDTQVNVSSNFDTVEKVVEIFSIPPQVAADIFKISAYQKPSISKNPLENLKKITENQLAIINPIPIGTGFLVGGSHLMTNHHVIQSKEIAAQCVAQFNYVENTQGYIQKSIDYEIDPILFVTEPSLDYTLVQLKSGMFTRQAGYEFDWLQLIEDEESVKPGLEWVEFRGDRQQVVSAWTSSDDVIQQLRDRGYTVVIEAEAIVIWHPEGAYDQDGIKAIGVQMGYGQFSEASKLVSKIKSFKATGDAVIIVQHPKGKQKQIVLNNNEIIKNGLYQGVLRYKAESDYGSSGSPVFNTHWKLVALHHAAVPGISESSSQTQQSETTDKPMAQQGIRICRIIEDLRKKSVTNSKLKSFIQDFVITAAQLNYPPLPTVVRLNSGASGQIDGYFNCGNHENLDISEAITCEAWVSTNNNENVIIFHRKEIREHNGMSMNHGYWMGLRQGRLYVELISAEDGCISLITKKIILQDGLWHHIAFTWRKPQEIKLYIDGEQAEANLEYNLEISSMIPPGKLNAPVLIGYGDGNDSFGGDIAEVRLWKTDRNQTQIKEAMYRRLTGDHRKQKLIGYWKFEKDRASKHYVHNIASPDGGLKVPSIDLFTPSPKIQPQFGLTLNGENDYIDCGRSFAIKNAITFESWVKLNETEGGGFVACQGGLGEEPGYSLMLRDNIVIVYLTGVNKEISIAFPADISINNDWHHIAFTWSSNSPNICVYIDGQGFPDQERFDGPIGLSAFNLCIGRNDAVSTFCFQGSIAEARLWRVARSEEQINEAMNRQLRDDEIDEDLLGYWPLCEEAGSEAANRAVRNRVGSQPGLVTGGSWLKPKYAVSYSQGKYGVPFGDVKWLKASECSASLPLPCGLKFNGKNDRVNCGQDPSLNVPDVITVEAWVKHRFGNCLIVSRGCYGGDGYSLCWHDGKIRVMFQDQTTNQKSIVDTKENAPVDQVWHHIAFTWDKTLQEIFIYMDGRQQDCVVMEGQSRSIAYAGQTKSMALFAGSLADLNTDFVIGSTPETEHYYNVTIAEVRLWKVVRTQDQIKTNMTCRLSCRDGDWHDLLGYWRLDDGGAGNTQARNLVSDSNHGVIEGAQWFPAPPVSIIQSQPLTSTENPSIPPPSV